MTSEIYKAGNRRRQILSGQPLLDNDDDIDNVIMMKIIMIMMMMTMMTMQMDDNGCYEATKLIDISISQIRCATQTSEVRLRKDAAIALDEPGGQRLLLGQRPVEISVRREAPA